MDLYDYLWWVVIWVMGAVYGWYARERHSKRIVDNFMEKIDSAVTEKVSENTIRIFIERVKDVYYIYNKENNDFMGQGSTREEVEKVLAERFPNKRFMADTSNLKEMGF
jgi:hypothetical protein